jgi:membrane-bound ClpP family serine protease
MPAASFSWLDLLVFMPVFGVIMLCGVVLFLLCTLFLLAGGLALFAVASEWVSDGFELDRQRKRR